MTYLDEFHLLIEDQKLANFLRLWEEYCMADQVDGKELKKVLNLVKNSTLSTTFGQFADTTLALWQKIDNQEDADDVLRLILDLQTSNTPLLADLAIDFLKKHYAGQKHFNQKLRIVGLLGRHNFQGAISNYELLTHMDKGKFVFHTGGWGVGEVMEISVLREHVLLEFEGTPALKELSFDNAFHNLIPLPSEHFLSRRFGDPDDLEQEAKEDPLSVIHLLLRDLGPKTAQEFKEELCDLVIPEDDWSKWWQAARAKMKKDTKIQSPKTAKEPFVLRDEEVPHDIILGEALKKTERIDALIQLIYNFSRDFPEVLKNFDIKQQIKGKLLPGLEGDETLPEFSMARKIQITLLLEEIFPDEFPDASSTLLKSMENLESVLNFIEIIAFKKKTLVIVRQSRKDWVPVFLHLLFMISQNTIRDYIFKELQADTAGKELLNEKIHELLNRMTLYPDAFFWYFQKVAADEDVPYSDQENGYHFLEAYLILLHFIETKPEQYKDLVKKMHQLLIAKRYLLVRKMIEGASREFLEEFLLLASKCQSFTKHDIRILQNLAEVVQPSLAKKKKEKKEEVELIWTTQEGYRQLHEKIQHIGTVETVDNAREIEAARALGDLRENSEYKFALERRSRLQAELKTLSEQLNQARILTKSDVKEDRVDVGSIVKIVDQKGKKTTYTLLGPWDADIESNILSYQSKLAEAMTGCKAGDTYEFNGKTFTVQSFKTIFS